MIVPVSPTAHASPVGHTDSPRSTSSVGLVVKVQGVHWLFTQVAPLQQSPSATHSPPAEEHLHFPLPQVPVQHWSFATQDAPVSTQQVAAAEQDVPLQQVAVRSQVSPTWTQAAVQVPLSQPPEQQSVDVAH